jgi:tetratricopeptide (TPR) repeat protein
MRALIWISLLALTVTGSNFAQGQGDTNAEDQQMMGLLASGAEKMRSGRAAEAITEHFDLVIAHYERKYRNNEGQVYSSRMQTETLAYLLQHATGTPKQKATVYTYGWGLAYFLKGYAYVEMRRLPEAAAALDAALALSPKNSQYLSERGQVHLIEKDFAAAFEKFSAAETAARTFSPESVKTTELSRALRGQAYIHIEQGKLDDAERIYRQCLELNANDAMAKGQLRYIAGLREKQADEAASQADPSYKTFALAWRMAEAQFISPSVRAYASGNVAGSTWNDQGVSRRLVMPEAKAAAECLTAIFPSPQKARMVFVIDDAGVVIGAHSDQGGVMDECIKGKVIGHRVPVPPKRPFAFHYCSRFERLNLTTTETSNCGPTTTVRICQQQGNTTHCKFEAR